MTEVWSAQAHRMDLLLGTAVSGNCICSSGLFHHDSLKLGGQPRWTSLASFCGLVCLRLQCSCTRSNCLHCRSMPVKHPPKAHQLNQCYIDNIDRRPKRELAMQHPRVVKHAMTCCLAGQRASGAGAVHAVWRGHLLHLHLPVFWHGQVRTPAPCCPQLLVHALKGTSPASLGGVTCTPVPQQSIPLVKTGTLKHMCSNLACRPRILEQRDVLQDRAQGD